jgi:tetratricopeptide (TPR) repeat protein
MLNRLCDAHPNRGAVLIESAIAFARVYDYAGVQSRFARLQSLPGVPCDYWVVMAQISESLRRPQWSLRFFSNAIAAKKPSAEAFRLFALFMERANDLDQANALLERGLAIDPKNPACQLARARVLRRQKSFDAAAASLKHLGDDPSVDPKVRISAWYELANIQDAQDECAAAMSSLAIAKSLTVKLPDFRFWLDYAAATDRYFLHLLAGLNAEYFRAVNNWVPSAKVSLALLAGHLRSGTTLLEQVLDAHTGIVSTDESRVFFDRIFEEFVRQAPAPAVCEAALRIPAVQLEQWRSNYLGSTQAMLERPLSNLLLLDKNPALTPGIPIIERVFPECFHLIALRDPRDVVLSCYFLDIQLNQNSVRFMNPRETAMRYGNTMSMWRACRQFMDPGKWMEVRYESLVNDLPGQTQAIMDRLNLPVQPGQLQPQVHAREHTVMSPTYADVTQPVHSRSVGRWKRYERWLEEAMPILQPFIEAFGYEA